MKINPRTPSLLKVLMTTLSKDDGAKYDFGVFIVGDSKDVVITFTVVATQFYFFFFVFP